jgi:hypothetical protein
MIRPLTRDLWPALEDLFGDNGAVGGCWCMYWRIGRAIRKQPREDGPPLPLGLADGGAHHSGSPAWRKLSRCRSRLGK